MIATLVRSSTVTRIAAGFAALGAAVAAQADILTTTDPTQIAAFQSGATVQTFDSISGITAVPITSYSPLDITGTSALLTKDPAQSPFYNSGGASFNDPVGNPGTPIGVVAPSGGIAGDKFSGNNVAGPLGVATPPFTVFEGGAFMEMIFPTAVSKVGLFVAHGSVQVFLKDADNNNILVGDASGTATAGQFLGITRPAADVRGVTVLGSGAFTIDDFTFAAPTGGNGGTGGGATVPDTGNAINLAIAGAFLMLANWKFTRKALAS